MTEQLAIRHPRRGKAHRPYWWAALCGFNWTMCCKSARRMTLTVPLTEVALGDRCKKCWPDDDAVLVPDRGADQ